MIVPGTMPEQFRLQEEKRNYLLNKEFDWSENAIGLITLYRTYLRKKDNGALETWNECVVRVIEGMFSIQKTHVIRSGLEWDEEKAQRTALDAAERLFEFKWTPPGRGLWMMGTNFMWERGGASLNNPLHEDTAILTKEYGWTTLGEIENEDVTVLSNTKLFGRDHTRNSALPTWVPAHISSFDVQDCVNITYKDEAGTVNTVTASKNHRWFKRRTTKDNWERVTSEELDEGDYLPITVPAKNYPVSLFGAQHGFFFGDGTRSNGELHQFSDSIPVMEEMFGKVDYVDNGRGKEGVVRNCPKAWSTIPKEEYLNDNSYVYGFLSGYFAADGTVNEAGQCRISSSRKEELERIRELAEGIGIRMTVPYKDSSVSTNYSSNRELWVCSFYKNDLQEKFFWKENHRFRWTNSLSKNARKNARVVEVKEAGQHRVLCATVPHYEQFVIDGFVLTSNCGYCTTENIAEEGSEPFRFLMDMSMLGVGIGFDTKGAGKTKITKPSGDKEIYVVEDTREGWVEAIGKLIDSYILGGSPVDIDTSKVRPYGEPIKGFGGVASGPGPLVQGFNGIKSVLENRAGEKITSVDITDIQNIIGKIVVAGNVRRTAEIAFGDPSDTDFRRMKSFKDNPEGMGMAAPSELKKVSAEDYKTFNENPFGNEAKEIIEKYKDREWAWKFGGWRWTSNNSLFATVGMDYTEIAESIAENGEPGLAWLENMQNYSRMIDKPDYKDERVRGGNPCLEQSLEPYELCTLVETYPVNNKSAKDFYDTLKVAYLYAKTVTLMATHNTRTNTVMCRNRRIGTSQSGVIDSVAKFGRHYYQKNMLDKAYHKVQDYDRKYSEWLGVPKSIKTTSVKPSGSVSLLANVSPGVHFPKVKHGYRTMRLAKDSPIVHALERANYHVEPSNADPYTTVVAYFPIIGNENVSSESDSTIWEQFTNAVMMQKYWADNQVSITISFKEDEKRHIAKCLSTFDSELKGVSLLPLIEHGFSQAPYIPAEKEDVMAYKKTLHPLDLSDMNLGEGENAEANKFCDSEGCAI